MMPTQSNLPADNVQDKDAASEAKAVQNAWGDDLPPSASQSDPSVEPETSVNPVDEPSTTPDANQTEAAKPDDEEYGEFVEASTDPLKRPLYDTTEQDDENRGLLDSKSRPVWEAECYIGMGLVEPVTAGVGIATRRVNHMARWKRNDTRANMIVAEWKRKQAQMAESRAIPVAAAADPSSAKDGSVPLAATALSAMHNEYLEKPRVMTSTSAMNGVMRPVRFAGSAIDEMVETERMAWGP
ncbi:hypothetical protein ACET3X_005732 [Alternaria dauci]|uniref:Uncharacterized protein n=1 Tax=Alternaria dauci TaxID=48095 RepID=A0ABR3UHM5_9PLEO